MRVTVLLVMFVTFGMFAQANAFAQASSADTGTVDHMFTMFTTNKSAGTSGGAKKAGATNKFAPGVCTWEMEQNLVCRGLCYWFFCNPFGGCFEGYRDCIVDCDEQFHCNFP